MAGRVWHGVVRCGAVRYGVAGLVRLVQVKLGEAWSGGLRHGRSGKAWRGEVRCDKVRCGLE